MPPKRRNEPGSSSSESDPDSSPQRKRSKRNRPYSQSDGDSDEEHTDLAVYVVQAKIDAETTNELYRLVEGFSPTKGPQLELCSAVEDADIVITNVRMRRRFERHVPWNIARQKAIVTPDWLRDSVKAGHPLPCGDFAALPELEEDTVEHCPDPETCQDKSHEHDHPRSTNHRSHSPGGRGSSVHAGQSGSYLNASSTVRPTDPKVFDQWRARYACLRAAPLVCPNQGLVEELNVLLRDRELEGLEKNALAYQRAIAVLKSYPKVITLDLLDEVRQLPGLGEKTAFKIEEYLETGYIPESQTTRASERYQSLSLFSSIYGIGSTKARQFFDMGMRTIEDLERYHDIPSGCDLKNPNVVEKLLLQMDQETSFTPNGKPIRWRGKAPDITIPTALVLREELKVPIPRDEVEEMHAVVMRELDELQPGCVSTVVGGYRRGKPESNDVDIVISHSDHKRGKDLIPGLCERFMSHLYKSGLVTHVMHLSGFHSYNALRTEHWDSLEKGLTVFRLPPSKEGQAQMHRRLDLIFALPESYWTAVIGWSGSKMFQRDLRLWAKQEKGMKFDSVGLTRRHDTKRFLPKSEKEVLDILGLPWIDPTMRNADV